MGRRSLGAQAVKSGGGGAGPVATRVNSFSLFQPGKELSQASNMEGYLMKAGQFNTAMQKRWFKLNG